MSNKQVGGDNMGNFNVVGDTELREKKIAVRVTKTEREFLECYAKIKGFRTISDCIRLHERSAGSARSTRLYFNHTMRLSTVES